MKLLLDANLSPRLVAAFQDLFPGSAHVRDAKLGSASDSEIWDVAAKRGFAILTKDSDFHQRSFLYGAPPKVIWLRIGNCTTGALEQFVRERAATIMAFAADAEGSFLVLAR